MLWLEVSLVTMVNVSVCEASSVQNLVENQTKVKIVLFHTRKKSDFRYYSGGLKINDL